MELLTGQWIFKLVAIFVDESTVVVAAEMTMSLALIMHIHVNVYRTRLVRLKPILRYTLLSLHLSNENITTRVIVLSGKNGIFKCLFIVWTHVSGFEHIWKYN